jgi:single-strand DNA-binding protein
VFGATADNLAKYTRKGSLVGVEGRLSQRTYENKEGKKVNYVEVICDRVQFLDPKGSNQGQDAPPNEPEAQEDNQNKSKNLESIDIVDDDLPF